MDRKYFQIKMREDTHEQLKFRAKQLGVSIGEFSENLVSSMELRLEKAYEMMDIQKGLADERFLKILLRHDLIDQKKLRDELNKVIKSTSTQKHVFDPTITV